MLGPRLPTFTLVTALLLALATPSGANAPNNLAHRGEHARMIKRYGVPDNNNSKRLLGSIFGAPDSSSGGTDAGSINAAPDPNGAAGANGAASSSSTSTQSTATGILGGISGIFGGGATTTTNSVSLTTLPTTTLPTTTTTTSTTTTSTPTSSTEPPTVTSAPTKTATNEPQPSSTTVTVDSPEAQAAEEQKQQRASTLSRIPPNVRTILIVVASSIVGLAIIWTVVRKWKFRSSRSFQDRLAPIDWQPDADKPNGSAPTGAMTEGGSDNASIRRNMFAPDEPSSLAPPPHDFTAGAGAMRSASPLPYGRTASPAPQALYRAPSNGSGRAGYDPSRGY